MRAFGVEGKLTPGHGVITRVHRLLPPGRGRHRHLYEALIDEFDLHPIDLEPERAYSPASLSKAYLAAMGITPLLERHPDFPREVLGYAMAAFFGGRAECRIRRVPSRSPLSTSPRCTRRSTPSWTFTGSSWPVDRDRESTEEVIDSWTTVTLDDCFDPELLAPAGRLRPGRARG